MASFIAKAGPYLLALALGLGIGCLDFHATEVQGAVLLMLLGGVGLGGLLANGAWLAGVILGAGIFLANVLARAVGYQPPSAPQPNVCAALLALLPALVGVAFGVGTRRLLRGPGAGSPP